MLYRSENGVEQFAVVALTPNTFGSSECPALLGRTFGRRTRSREPRAWLS